MFFFHTFILSVDCAVKSLITVEYRHAVIAPTVVGEIGDLTFHLMVHIIVSYQRLLICSDFYYSNLCATYDMSHVSSIAIAITD